MSNNIKIAHQYAKKMASLTANTGIWVSDNLPTVSRGERKLILKVYKNYFKNVEYNTTTGVCVCSLPKV